MFWATLQDLNRIIKNIVIFFHLNRKIKIFRHLGCGFERRTHSLNWMCHKGPCITASFNMAIGHISSWDGCMQESIHSVGMGLKKHIDLYPNRFSDKTIAAQISLSGSFGAFNCIMWSLSVEWICTVIKEISILRFPFTVTMRLKVNSNKTLFKVNSEVIIFVFTTVSNSKQNRILVNGGLKAVFLRIWWGSPDNRPPRDLQMRVKYFY